MELECRTYGGTARFKVMDKKAILTARWTQFGHFSIWTG